MRRFLIAVAIISFFVAFLIPIHAHAATALTAPCPGATDFPLTDQNAKLYEVFNGTTVFHENLWGDPADDLKVVSGYAAPKPSSTGQSLHFNNDSIVATATNRFNPGTRNFALCIKYQDAAQDDGHNALNIGNRHAYPTLWGQCKIVAYYGSCQTLVEKVRVHTQLTTMRGLGYKTLTMARRGNVLSMYVDGKLTEQKSITGSIPMNQVTVLGGKKELPHTTKEDLLWGDVASLRLVIQTQLKEQ